jgi:hypothetical protein
MRTCRLRWLRRGGLRLLLVRRAADVQRSALNWRQAAGVKGTRSWVRRVMTNSDPQFEVAVPQLTAT